jgi:hypothetical protein
MLWLICIVKMAAVNAEKTMIDQTDSLATLAQRDTRTHGSSAVWEVPMALNLSMLYQLRHFIIWFRSSRPTPNIKKGSVPVPPELAQVPQREEEVL